MNINDSKTYNLSWEFELREVKGKKPTPIKILDFCNARTVGNNRLAILNDKWTIFWQGDIVAHVDRPNIPCGIVINKAKPNEDVIIMNYGVY